MRITFARLLAAAVLLLAQSAWSKAPNIVYILADDLDAATAAEMPEVRSLIAEQGASFQQHMVSLSLCCPSRISALRGQFAHNTGIFTNSRKTGGGFVYIHKLGLEASTAATWLQAAGYRTAMFGKYFNEYPDKAPSKLYIPPGWSEWLSPIEGTPYKGFDYVVNDNGSRHSHGAEPGDYLTDVLSKRATRFIRESIANQPEQPFFLYLSTYAPHSPATPAPRHAALFSELDAPQMSSFNEEDVSDKPAWVRDKPRLDRTLIKKINELYRNRRRSLLAVDEMVRAVMDTLQSQGVLQDTYVIFTSDNGFHQGQHRLDSGKDTAYEEDLLVPLWIRGPGVAAGRQVDLLTANVDVAPTLADLAGATMPDFVDGRSLRPLLSGTPPSWRQALLLEHKGVDATVVRRVDGPWEPLDGVPPGIKPFSGLRLADRTTYVAYDHGEFEFYDNLLDPLQESNRYAQTDATTRARLAAWLASLRQAGGAALRQAELAPP
ncbi:MAG: sulfatase [Burkholderiales bacterium]|nr:sulfatase [Burkholderiales bacterium]